MRTLRHRFQLGLGARPRPAAGGAGDRRGGHVRLPPRCVDHDRHPALRRPHRGARRADAAARRAGRRARRSATACARWRRASARSRSRPTPAASSPTSPDAANRDDRGAAQRGTLARRRRRHAPPGHRRGLPRPAHTPDIASACSRRRSTTSSSTPQTARRYVKTMGANVRALGTLIDDLFELSRLNAGDFAWSTEAVPLAELVAGDGARRCARRPRREACCAARDIAADLAPARANPEKLGRVLANLLQNAIHHTPARRQRARARAAREWQRARSRSPDTGEGIAAGRPATRLRALLPRRQRGGPHQRGQRPRPRHRARDRGGPRRTHLARRGRGQHRPRTRTGTGTGTGTGGADGTGGTRVKVALPIAD